jgi:hypothetical protein
MARARSTINLETEWAFIALWAVRGLAHVQATSCLNRSSPNAGATLGQIAKAMETDSDIMLPMKYWEIVVDKLSAAGRSWGYCSAVTRKRS